MLPTDDWYEFSPHLYKTNFEYVLHPIVITPEVGLRKSTSMSAFGHHPIRHHA
jgi:hypothetical protein